MFQQTQSATVRRRRGRRSPLSIKTGVTGLPAKGSGSGKGGAEVAAKQAAGVRSGGSDDVAETRAGAEQVIPKLDRRVNADYCSVDTDRETSTDTDDDCEIDTSKCNETNSEERSPKQT